MANKSQPKGSVRKVYVSDSPVHDDNIEYNYVSSDIEDDLEKSDKIVNRLKTPGPQSMRGRRQKTNNSVNGPQKTIVKEPAPAVEMSEEDELAKEAQYQKELQERLQQTNLDENG